MTADSYKVEYFNNIMNIANTDNASVRCYHFLPSSWSMPSKQSSSKAVSQIENLKQCVRFQFSILCINFQSYVVTPCYGKNFLAKAHILRSNATRFSEQMFKMSTERMEKVRIRGVEKNMAKCLMKMASASEDSCVWVCCCCDCDLITMIWLCKQLNLHSSIRKRDFCAAVLQLYHCEDAADYSPLPF